MSPDPAPAVHQAGIHKRVVLRWGVLSKAQQDDFTYFIGDRVLRLKAPSLFCVSVRPDAPRVVLFYVRPLLQDLADATFERPRACDRLEDALNALHDPQAEHRAFVHHAYDALPPAPPPAPRPPSPRTRCRGSTEREQLRQQTRQRHLSRCSVGLGRVSAPTFPVRARRSRNASRNATPL